jgi:uncharacterized protein YkwD
MGCKNVSDKYDNNNQQKRTQQPYSARIIGQENKPVIDNDTIEQSKGGNTLRKGKREIITTREITTRHPDGRIEKKIITETHYINDDDNDNDYNNNDNNNSNKHYSNPFQHKLINQYQQAEQKTKLDLNELRQEALTAHNQYRQKHRAPPLKLNIELNEIAQRYAEELAAKDLFQHSQNTWKGENIGENLFMCSGYLITGHAMTKSWYDEIKDYNFNKATFSSGTGHFTQVVWVDSQYVGFGAAKSRSGYYIGVANYYPAGNFLGQFYKNVLAG